MFGTGHSALNAGDTFQRAGGLACVNAILEQPLSVGACGLFSSWTERQTGLANLILDRYDLRAGEPIIIFSVSGVNALPVEVAAESRRRGISVIVVVSREFCEYLSAARSLKTTLLAEADVVIDNHVPVGDALLPLPSSEYRLASSSTICAALIYNCILERTAMLLSQLNVPVPVFASLNLPGAAEHNAELIARYRSRIRNF